MVVTDHKPLTALFTQTKYLYEFMNESTGTTILQVQTRSRTRETQLLKDNSDREKNEQIETYTIEERNHVQIEQKNFDQIYYLLDGMKCNIIQQIQIKLKKKIKISEPITYYQLYKIDSVRKMVFIPNIDGSANFSEKMKLIIHQILNDAANISAERMAVNVDIRSNARYIEIKGIYREIFKGSEVETTFFLNKVIEVTRMEDIESILHTYHRAKLGGHVGSERMRNTIRTFYSWPTMSKDIREYVKKCSICEQSKINTHTRTPMQISSLASHPFEKIYIDFVGEISPPSSKGFKYIFTCSCELTKYAVAVPTMDCTALTAAKALFKNVCLLFGIPKTLVLTMEARSSQACLRK